MEWIELVKRDLEEGVEALLGSKAFREILLHDTLDLLDKVEWRLRKLTESGALCFTPTRSRLSATQIG